MILTCPSCGTQYMVKDGAIPPEGRQVRCAACKHSWHQDPDAGAEVEPEQGTAVAADAVGEGAPPAELDHGEVEDESLAGAIVIDPRSGPEAEERAFEEAAVESDAGATSTEELTAADADAVAAPPAVQDWREPPEGEASPDMFNPFAAEYEQEPRRRTPLTTVLIIAVAVIVLAALFWFFAPIELKARLGLAAGGVSPLGLVISHRERQPLESGNELLTVSGRVINPSTKEQDVPPIQAQLKNRAGKIVYSWTIQPPARSLAPGRSASFNSAEVNVPPGGEFLTVTVGQPKA